MGRHATAEPPPTAGAGLARTHPPSANAWLGPLLAVVGVLGFSFKAILIKLAYRYGPADPVALLTLRMLYAAPFFVAMAWWSGRAPGARPIGASDMRRLVGLGFIGYYVSSLLDFMGLQYITASLERLVLFLYPTIVVVLSAIFLAKPVTRRAVAALVLSYAGIALAVWHDVRITGDAPAIALGSALVFASAVGYAIYLVGAGGIIARLGSSRFIAWAMLASTVFIGVQFALTRPVEALALPASVQGLAVAMAIFSTVLPTWMIAESIRRIGASTASLIGSLGPVFTIGLGALMLGEAVNLLQLVGVVLVLAGVMLVSRGPRPGAAAKRAPAH
ncbi:MAG: DMT family transporter [Betaproteobacteria bacterium]|jgi:drug/metabolite transporter (DMT)-like permease